jgi:hypothetical protein
MKLYIALLHHPVHNKSGEVITTSITGFDLHDIARSALTYGVSGYYVVNPIAAQLNFAERIVGCWRKGESFDFNPTRAEAFELLKLASSLDEVKESIKSVCGAYPKVVATSAKAENGVSYSDLSEKIKRSDEPYLLIFGTGWGLTKEAIDSSDIVLEPIVGVTDYRHLSVRSAVAVILDRLLGKRGS